MRTKFIRIIIPTVSHYSIHYVFTLIMLLNGLLLTSFGAHRLIRYLKIFWAKMLFWSMGRTVAVRNREHLISDKSYLVVMNHSSMFDIPAIMTVIPDGSWIGREKLLRIPVFGNFLKRINYIPIDPAHWRKSMEALKKAVANSSSGISVLIFPEGTRTLDGNIQQFNKGFVKIMRDTGADILPITIKGLYTWKSKHQRYINAGEKPEIIINEPINAEALMSLKDNEIISNVKKVIESSYYPRDGV